MDMRKMTLKDSRRKETLSLWETSLREIQPVSDKGSDVAIISIPAQNSAGFLTASCIWGERQATTVETLEHTDSAISGRHEEDESGVAAQQSERLGKRNRRFACHFCKYNPFKYDEVRNYEFGWSIRRLKEHIWRPYAKAAEIEEHGSRTKDIETTKSLLPGLNPPVDGGRGRPFGLELAANMSAWTSSAILSCFAKAGEKLDVLGHDKPLGAYGETMKHATEHSEPFISKPALGILAMNVLVFGTSVSTMYHIHRDDQFQDRILAAAMTIGFVVGKLIGYKTEATILGILPWAILLALSLSAVGHRIMRSMKIIPKIHESDLLN